MASMNRSRTITLAALYVVSIPVAVVVWLILYARGYAFHLGRVHFTPGVLALSGMSIVDVLVFFLLSRKSK